MEPAPAQERLTPLASAQRYLARARAAGADRFLVALSGGKDSLVSLDLAVKAIGADRVQAFFQYLVPGLRCEEAPIDYAARRYGIPITKVPHWELGRMVKYAVLRPHIAGTQGWRETKLADVEALVRQRTGCDWIVYGHRADESPERRGMLKACDGVDIARRRVYPVRWWKGRDSYAYLRHHHIPVPSMFGGARNAGVELTAECLAFLKEHHPDDYAKILEFFPFAEAVLVRAQMYGLPITAADRRKHGHASTGVVSAEYRSWAAMLQRCTNPHHKHFNKYGGAGVTVCDRWANSFQDFLADMGKRPGLEYSLERVDGSKGYEPGNCRWATRKEQQRNRTVVKVVEHAGRSQSVSAWAEEAGLPTNVLANRLARGWTMERALGTPAGAR